MISSPRQSSPSSRASFFIWPTSGHSPGYEGWRDKIGFSKFCSSYDYLRQALTSQVQTMKAQANREIGPRVNQHASTWLPVWGNLLGRILLCSLDPRFENIPKTFLIRSTRSYLLWGDFNWKSRASLLSTQGCVPNICIINGVTSQNHTLDVRGNLILQPVYLTCRRYCSSPYISLIAYP